MSYDEARAVVKLYHQHHLLARVIYCYSKGVHAVLVSRNGDELLILDRAAAHLNLGYHFTARVDIT